MESITDLKEIDGLKNNNVIFSPNRNVFVEKCKFIFHGKNNILCLGDNIHIKNSILNFQGDNSIVYLSSSKHVYYLNISIYNNSVLYFGKNNYFNDILNIILSEQTHVLIGNDCLFSFDIWLRTADPHLIYDVESKERKNYSKSIFIGDHVWVGQNAFVLKGTQVGSGSIIGAASVVPNKKIPSNTSWAGNPAKQIGKKVFFTSSCVHRFTDSETKKTSKYESEQWIYEEDEEERLSFDIINSAFSVGKAEDKLKYIKDVINKETKNRFFIPGNKHELKEGRKLKKWLLKIWRSGNVL